MARTLDIGVTTAVFTFGNAAPLRALPISDPDGVVHLGMVDSAGREFDQATQPTDISRINRRHYWPRLGVDPGLFLEKNKEKSAEM